MLLTAFVLQFIGGGYQAIKQSSLLLLVFEMEPDRAQNRFDNTNHWASYDDKPSRSLCKIKDCHNLTHVFCTKCQVHLCLIPKRNCFYRFHNHDVDLLNVKKKSITFTKASKEPQAAPQVPSDEATPVVALPQPVIQPLKCKTNSTKRLIKSRAQSTKLPPNRKKGSSANKIRFATTASFTIKNNYFLRSTKKSGKMGEQGTACARNRLCSGMAVTSCDSEFMIFLDYLKLKPTQTKN